MRKPEDLLPIRSGPNRDWDGSIEPDAVWTRGKTNLVAYSDSYRYVRSVLGRHLHRFTPFKTKGGWECAVHSWRRQVLAEYEKRTPRCRCGTCLCPKIGYFKRPHTLSVKEVYSLANVYLACGGCGKAINHLPTSYDFVSASKIFDDDTPILIPQIEFMDCWKDC